MKKHELIALLALYPDDIEVFIPAYEDGWARVTEVSVRPLSKFPWHDPYRGEFMDDDKGDPALVLT